MNICLRIAGSQKKEKKTRKCYKCDKRRHLVKNCRLERKIKNRSIQEEIDNKDSGKEESFVRGSE